MEEGYTCQLQGNISCRQDDYWSVEAYRCAKGACRFCVSCRQRKGLCQCLDRLQELQGNHCTFQ